MDTGGDSDGVQHTGRPALTTGRGSTAVAGKRTRWAMKRRRAVGRKKWTR